MRITKRNYEHLLNEIHVQKTSVHPNVVEILQACRSGEYLWLVLEYMSGGTLNDIVECRITLAEAHIAYIMLQVLKALSYLHSLHRIHRDIKSDNILIGRQGEIKIGAPRPAPGHVRG